MSAIYSADLLYKTDAQLQSLVSAEAKKKYETLPSEEIVAATKAALEAKNHKVTVVNTGAEALQLIKDTIPKGTEITSYGSTTLQQIGYSDYSQSADAHWTDIRGLLYTNKDPTKVKEIAAKRLTAEFSVGSVSAIAQTGEIILVDASATRVAPPQTSTNVIFVASINKIEPTLESAWTRVKDYVFQVESARCREVYKFPSSSLNYEVVFHKSHIPNRIHVILVKDEILGY